MSGRVKQNIVLHEMDRELEGMMAEGRGACKAVDLGRLSNMPKAVFQKILDQTDYENLTQLQPNFRESKLHTVLSRTLF